MGDKSDTTDLQSSTQEKDEATDSSFVMESEPSESDFSDLPDEDEVGLDSAQTSKQMTIYVDSDTEREFTNLMNTIENRYRIVNEFNGSRGLMYDMAIRVVLEHRAEFAEMVINEIKRKTV